MTDDDRRDLDRSAAAAGRYFSDLMRRYHGDIAEALAGYNWGSGDAAHPRLDDAISRYGSDWLSHAPRETQDYVRAIAPGLQQRPAVTMPPDVRVSVNVAPGANVIASAMALPR